MDLVSTYLSDEETENHGNQEEAMRKSNENENSGEESDVIDIIFESNASSAVKKRKPTGTEIECICLDDSDSDNTEVSNSTKLSQCHTDTPTVKKNVAKKIDYLNLESSDTDEEQGSIQDNVNKLLNSAAILNDIECGPTKPIPEIEILSSSPSSSHDTSFCGKRPNSPVLPIDHGDDSTTASITDICKEDNSKIYFQEDLSNKKIKFDQLTLGTLDGFDLKMRMYRKDERIIAAYKKKRISHIPTVLNQSTTAHQNVISSLSWCGMPYSHLLLSSSLDRTVKIWDIYTPNKPTQILNFSFAIRASKWSKSGEEIVAGGFGKDVYVVDVLSGIPHLIYKIYNHVSSIAVHPAIEDLILVGTKNAVLGFDLRVNSVLPVRTFLSKCGEVLDIAFLNNNEFACSTNVVSHDSADRTIMVWDFNSGALMSNQIFLERYTCPSLKVNPFDSSFIAQTNGDYIATFSSQRPYKRKNYTYIGHKVSGFGIECDVSPDGQYVASGDAKGDVYFYDYSDATLVNKLSVKPDVATNKLQWHPLLSSNMAVATWDGQIHFWN